MYKWISMMTAGLVAVSACAQTPETPYDHGEVTPPAPFTEHPDSTGWETLFGENLSAAINPGGAWTVDEEGVLVTLESVDLFTTEDFDDFIIDLEFKNGEGSNSGVIVYTNDHTNWIPNAIEIQVHDSYTSDPDHVPTIHECGSIYGHVPPSEQRVRPAGEWNRMSIRCVGPFLDVVLNGAHVAHMDMREWTSAKVNPDGSEIPEWLSRPKAALEPRGRIGLQGLHGDEPPLFRNLRVSRL